MRGIGGDTGGRWSFSFAALFSRIVMLGAERNWRRAGSLFGSKPSKLPPAAYQAGRQTDRQRERDRRTDSSSHALKYAKLGTHKN